jgi:hypothetical protein
MLVARRGSRSLKYHFRFTRTHPGLRIEVARGGLTVVSAAQSTDGSLKAVALPEILVRKIEQAPAELLAELDPPRGTAPAVADLVKRVSVP